MKTRNNLLSSICSIPTKHRQQRATVLTLLISINMAVSAIADPSEKNPGPADQNFDVEVLSVQVSKLKRDPFGEAENPFSQFKRNEGEAGTVVLSKITSKLSAGMELHPEKCRLVSFKDDLGTDLFTNGTSGLGSDFFARNRALEVMTGGGSNPFGLRVRSSLLPAHAANRLTASVVLVFSPTSEEQTIQKSDVLVQTNSVVTVGPLKIKFYVVSSGSHGRTNDAAVLPPPVYWAASFLPEPDIAIASVTFFSTKDDEPVLALRNLEAKKAAASSNNSSHRARAGHENPEDEFSGCSGYSMRGSKPTYGLITVKLRYFKQGSFVEKPCIISTGLSP